MSHKNKRFQIRMSEDLHYTMNEYASKKGVSANTFVNDAIEQAIRIEAGLYDFNQPALERLNQLVDALVGLSARVDVLSDQVEDQRKLFSQYMIGANYLND